MKTIVKVEHKSTYNHVEFTVCDICKKQYKGENWERGNYSALETTVLLKTGSSFPEGGSGEETEFDICPKCFETRLIPLLKREFDATPTITDWDF